MEARTVKNHFDLNHQSVTKKKTMNQKDSGHLVFNIPNRTDVVNREIVPVMEEVVAFPFFTLSIKNQPELFKVGKSFINDIAQNRNQFGFTSLFNGGNEKYLLAYASYINYTLKRPVLIVVKNLLDNSFDQYRQNFTPGTLWKWNTWDWGNLCFIDYSQISAHAESFNLLDFKVITDEFVAVLWSLPEGDLNNYIPRNAFSILEKVSSITMIVSKGKTIIKNLKKAVNYYQCFGIPVKGILMEGEAQ